MAAQLTKSNPSPLLVIVGPTASGKTALAIDLAKKFNGEIICADSRTIYKDMDIGTAKPTLPEQDGIPHHLLDIIGPGEAFTVADFKNLAGKVIEDISSRGKLPIMVGGSGLYIDSVIYDYDFANTASGRDTQNPRHLSRVGPSQPRDLRANTLVLGLDVDPEVLGQRIAERIEAMLQAGLVREAERLVSKYGWDIEAMKTYQPLRDYMEGRETEAEAIAKMVIKDRQLAKKQRTWFKRNNSIHWLPDPSKSVDIVTTFLNTR